MPGKLANPGSDKEEDGKIARALTIGAVGVRYPHSTTTKPSVVDARNERRCEPVLWGMQSLRVGCEDGPKGARNNRPIIRGDMV